MRRLSRVGAVVFDCDSTLSAVEGIDELAGERRAEIEQLTSAAMRGEVPLEAVYGRRLELIRPSRERVEALGRLYVERLVPDAGEVVAALAGEGIEVRIMSGGLTPAVQAIAAAVGVPPSKVAAVDIGFDEGGAYAGWDTAAPLARAGGKREVMRVWRRELGRAVMFVGDGATDLEASDVADVFVAYAGVVERARVVAEADVVIRSASLAPVLPLALAGAPPRMTASMPLFRRGLELLEERYRRGLNHFTGP